MSKRIKHIYFVTQQNGNNLLLNIRLKYIQKIPVKYLVIKKHNFKFSSLYSKQLFQQKTLRTYYNIMSKRFLKDLYIKAKKKNIQKSFWLRRYIEYKLDSFLVNIWFFKSIFQARQYITHGKVYIENTIITNSSYIVTLNKLIELKKNTITNWKLSNIDIKKFFLIPNSTISYSWVYYFLLHLYNLNYSSVKCTTYFLT